MLTPLIFALFNGPYLSEASSSSPPSAEADAAARRYFENGKTLYAEGRYADSIVAFQEAYRLSGKHALLFNIASAQERLGDLKGAIENLSTYRIHADPEEQATLGRRIDNLNMRLLEQSKNKNQNDTVESPTAKAKSKNDGASEAKQSDPNTRVVAPSNPIKKVNNVSLKPWIGGTAALSLMGLVGGTYFSVTAQNNRTELEGLCKSGLCPSSAADISASEEQALQGASLSWGLGIISGGAAAALWFWDSKRLQETEK